jgi:hypothetical protein
VTLVSSANRRSAIVTRQATTNADYRTLPIHQEGSHIWTGLLMRSKKTHKLPILLIATGLTVKPYLCLEGRDLPPWVARRGASSWKPAVNGKKQNAR